MSLDYVLQRHFSHKFVLILISETLQMKSQKEIYFVEYNVFLTNQLFTRDLIWDIDSNLSTGLDIGLAYEEIKKVLQD